MSGEIPVVKPQSVIRALEKKGFYIHHQTGGHVALRHKEDKRKRVTVPRHNKDIKSGTLVNVLKQADLGIAEFRKLL